MEKDKVSRREFIEHSAKNILGAVVVAHCGMACSKVSVDTDTPLTPVAGVVTLTFADYPDLASENGAYQISVITRRATARINVQNIDGVVSAVTAVCPHEGNVVAKWNGSNFTCPSHGSTFSKSGAVTKGPAATALVSYTTSVSSTGVDIEIA